MPALCRHLEAAKHLLDTSLRTLQSAIPDLSGVRAAAAIRAATPDGAGSWTMR